MARNWTVQIHGGTGTTIPSTGGAARDVLPTTGRPCDAFDPLTDESVILEFAVPQEHTGTGTLKLDLWYCANTVTATDDARIDVYTEFRSPGVGESADADAFDVTPDSATLTFSDIAYSVEKATITLTPATTPAPGDVARVKVSRDADNASGLDDLAVDLLVLHYDVYEEA